MVAEKQKQESILSRICLAAFSECFIAWVHLKAIRIFVECVLRYGVPPDFNAFVLKVGKRLIFIHPITFYDIGSKQGKRI